MRTARNDTHMHWATLQGAVLNDPKALTLILTAWVNLWFGPDTLSADLNPGETKLRRPSWMSDKVFHSTKARLKKLGLLEVRTFRQRTICRLTDACKQLLHLHAAWGETEGETPCPRSQGSTTYPRQQRQKSGEPRGETSKDRTKLSQKSGGLRGGTWDKCMPPTNAHPLTLARLQPDLKGGSWGESEGKTRAETGRTACSKDYKNIDSGSMGELAEDLWKEVAPARNAEMPPKELFRRKCLEWLSELTEEAVRALIWYGNKNAESGYVGYITRTIARGGADDALDEWRAAISKKQKAITPQKPPESPEEIARRCERGPLYAALGVAKNHNDQAEIERLETALGLNLVQSGQPTPCGHGPLSGTGQGLCPLEPREDEDKEPKA